MQRSIWKAISICWWKIWCLLFAPMTRKIFTKYVFFNKKNQHYLLDTLNSKCNHQHLPLSFFMKLLPKHIICFFWNFVVRGAHNINKSTTKLKITKVLCKAPKPLNLNEIISKLWGLLWNGNMAHLYEAPQTR